MLISRVSLLNKIWIFTCVLIRKNIAHKNKIVPLTLIKKFLKVKRFDHIGDLHQLRMQIRLTMVK